MRCPTACLPIRATDEALGELRFGISKATRDAYIADRGETYSLQLHTLADEAGPHPSMCSAQW